MITPGQAADKAGLTVGSIIISIDGFKINDAVSAIVRVRSRVPGDQIIMVVESPSGASKTLNITLGSVSALP
jgi:putative serine protease PepD